MVGEGILYCLQSRPWGRGGRDGAEGSIHAGGCSFSSFLRRTVRFVGELPTGVPAPPEPHAPSCTPGPDPSAPQVSRCSACVPRLW